MKVSKEVKTGALALVAIALFVFGYNYMKGHNILDSSKEIYAVYDDVEGLSNSSDVVINGLKIGKVTEIDFLNESGEILVTMRIKNDFEFSKNSIAQIYSDGLIGGKVMKILPDYAAETVKSGDTLPSEIEEGVIANVVSRLVPLREKLEGAMGGIDTLVQSLNNVLDESGQQDLKESLSSFNSTMKNLNESSAHINGLLDRNSTKLDSVIGNFDKTAENLGSFSDSLALIEMQPILAKIDNTLNDLNAVSSKLESGEGTAGKLINDEELYNNLERTSKQMEELVQDIKLNPRRYIDLRFSIFGKKNKSEPYTKPDDSLE